MANVISKISVMLSASAGSVKRGVAEAKGALAGYGRSVNGINKNNPFKGAQAGATGLTGTVGALTSKLGALGAAFGVAFGVGGAISSIKASWELMDSQKELADQLGVSIEGLTGLSYISDVVGGNTEALSGSISKMQKLFGNAANGQKAATDTLAKYGMTAKDFIGLSVEDQIGKISDKFKSLESQEQKVVMATDIFGKSGADMINMLSLGSGEIDKMITKAKDLGVVFDDQMAKKASDAQDAILELDMAWQGLTNSLAVKLAPDAVLTMKWLASLTQEAKDLEKLNSGLASSNALDPRIAEGERLPDGSFPKVLHAGSEEAVVAEENKMNLKKAFGNVLSGSSPIAPSSSNPVASMVDDLFAPKKMAAGSGVMTQSGKDMAAKGGSDYIDSFYDSITSGGTGDPAIDKAKAQSDFFQQEHKQRLLDLEAIEKQELANVAADEEKKKLLEEQTKQYDDQVKALEDAKRIQGGFIISKAGRTAAGADFTTGGTIPSMSATPIGDGGINKDSQIVTELQEQTNYLRVLASKPQVASFA